MATVKLDRTLEALLEYLKRNRGFDFTGYKRASLARRIDKRMHAVGVKDYTDYMDYLEVHPDEFASLFNTILINVTSFFRDESTWQYLADEVIPRLLESRPQGAPVRVWSAGCASGEEPYTLAMMFAEALGPEAFKTRVKIYGTDVDDDALARGRQATYSEKDVAALPPKLLEKYFENADTKFVFRKDFRRQVIFGRHDLTSDAPISRVDLLVCRNTLMYLNSETQGKILARFHFALNDGGILFLGRAETLLAHSSTFQPVDLKRRISTKVVRSKLSLRDRLLLVAENATDDAGNVAHNVRLREMVLDSTPATQLAVDRAGALVLANARARSMLGLGADDIGRPLQDLSISYRPVELRSLIDQARGDRRSVFAHNVEWAAPAGDTRWFELEVVPLMERGTYLGASIIFTDVTEAKRLQRDLEAARLDLQAAYEALQSTNEELETTNEELQSTIEELETTNEELHSTNEELETLNEELQSTNEELQTMNDELRIRTDELNEVNGYMQSILTSIRGGVIVIDREQRITMWNEHAHDLWGLRQEEILGKHLLGLDLGLPVAELRAPIKRILTDREHESVVVSAINRRGRSFRCEVSLSRLCNRDGELRGVILVTYDADNSG